MYRDIENIEHWKDFKKTVTKCPPTLTNLLAQAEVGDHGRVVVCEEREGDTPALGKIRQDGF